MKVIDLGHGEFAIEPDSAADSLQILSTSQLQRNKVSNEAIDIYRRYIERTSAGKRMALTTDLYTSLKSG
jgi:hypothetical protein